VTFISSSSASQTCICLLRLPQYILVRGKKKKANFDNHLPVSKTDKSLRIQRISCSNFLLDSNPEFYCIVCHRIARNAHTACKGSYKAHYQKVQPQCLHHVAARHRGSCIAMLPRQCPCCHQQCLGEPVASLGVRAVIVSEAVRCPDAATGRGIRARLTLIGRSAYERPFRVPTGCGTVPRSELEAHVADSFGQHMYAFSKVCICPYGSAYQ